MKSYTTLIKGARLVVETCFAVKAGRRRAHHLRRGSPARSRGHGWGGGVDGGLPGGGRHLASRQRGPGLDERPHGAGQEPGRRDGRLRRHHHHHQPGVGEPLRPRQPRCCKREQGSQDRLGGRGHGRLGSHQRGDRSDRRSVREAHSRPGGSRVGARAPTLPVPTSGYASRAARRSKWCPSRVPER